MWLLVIVLLLIGVPAGAAINEVGSGSQRAGYAGTSEEPSHGLPFGGNVTAGNLIVVAGAVWQTSVPASISVSDSQATSYTVLDGTLGSTIRIFIAYGIAGGSGANTVTVDPDGSAYISFGINEFSGVDSTPLDADGGQSTASDSAPQDGITTVADNALIIGVVTQNSGSITITPDSGWTEIGESEDGSNTQPYNAMFQIVTSAGAYTASWTFAAARTWAARSASFEPATGGGTAARHRRQLWY
jgi:hypothetical protein